MHPARNHEEDPVVILAQCDDGLHLFYPPTLSTRDVLDMLEAAFRRVSDDSLLTA